MGNDTKSDKVLTDKSADDDDRVVECTIPVSWRGWDQLDTTCFSFYEVLFRDDFGVFKAGETVSCLTVDYSAGTLIEYDEGGTKLRKQSWTAVPVVE